MPIDPPPALSAGTLEAFRQQARACEETGSPFNALVCEVLATDLDLTSEFGRRVAMWPAEMVGPDALALRCCGAFNALARSRPDTVLAMVYPPEPQPDRAQLAKVLRDALQLHDRELTAWLDGPPQTNEVARSALTLGGFIQIAEETQQPLALYEIGASAGLNLLFDRYSYDLGEGRVWGDPQSSVKIHCEWSGALPNLGQRVNVASRAGCDIRPIDARNPADRFRLLTYIWPDQSARLARTGAALNVIARQGLKVTEADAADWVDAMLSPPQQGRTRVLLHTIMWQYLPQTVRDRIETRLEVCGKAATATAPLARLAMEADTQGRGAGLRLTLWPGGQERLIARVSFHGQWAEWL